MAVVYLDSWEHGRAVVTTNLYSGAGTGQSISTSTYRTGTRSLRCAPASNSQYLTRGITGTTDGTTGFYIRFATLPPDGAILFRVGASTFVRIYYASATQQFTIDHSSAGGATAFGPTLTTGVWYKVLLKWNTSTNPWSATVSVDGAYETTIAPAVTGASLTVVNWGNTATVASGEWFYDDAFIDDDEGAYTTLKSADWQVQALIVNGDGSHNIATSGDFDSYTTTAFDNSTTDGYTYLDHRPLLFSNAANQVIRQELGTTTDYMEFTLENLTSPGTAEVWGVSGIGVHAENVASGASQGEMRVYESDGTSLCTPDIIASTNDPGTTTTLRHVILSRASGSWSSSVVDGLLLRIGYADNAPDVNFIDAMLQVMLYETSEAAEQFFAVVTAT